mmetsp:Transcript_72627/g.126084  ORF Transcript_72627/g.126084 Transcript_72627/m.126084 type:complete len:263 (-) Transcript_72627:100-888(-)
MPARVPTQLQVHSVSVTKADGARVGLGLNTCDGATLRIIRVESAGLVPDWNRTHPEQQVRPGDRIVEVNGVKGDANAMLNECKERQELQFQICCTADIEHWCRMLQYRNLSPEDFELLRMLDEVAPSKHGAPRSLVEALPREAAHSCGAQECAVCLAEFAHDTMVTRLPCQHIFCAPCIEEWLTQYKSRCPLCLSSIGDWIDRQASTRAPSLESSPDDSEDCRWDVGVESEVHVSLKQPKIHSVTRCEGLGSRQSVVEYRQF